MKATDLINRDIPCACGRIHRCDVPYFAAGEGALAKLTEWRGGFSHILLVADENTDAVAGARVRALLGEQSFRSCMFQTKKPVIPNEDAVAYVESMMDEQTDLVLGIGSGVINDICKYVSFQKKIPCGIVATAPSMDGYASSGAAMIFKGMKVTFTTHAPLMILGDAAILKTAPMEMIRAGYADIIGKYSALCDWRLSEAVNGEYFCPFIYRAVKEKTDEIRALAPRLAKRDGEAVGVLMDALVMIGACMTLIETTRPASGSEHHLSHYFEITGLIENSPYFLHGIDVGYATAVTAALREEIVAMNVPVFHSVDRHRRMACYQKIYGAFAEEVMAIQDKAGQYERNMEGIYRARWEQIRAILSECPTAAEITEMLRDVGFVMEDFEGLYGKRKIRNGVWFGKDLKDRYSVLWLYGALRLTDSELENILS